MLIRAVVLLALTAMVLAASEKPDFSGKWRAEAPAQDDALTTTLTIQQTGGELRITSGPEHKQVTDVTCNTVGKECEGRLNGQPVKVTYWYNGPTLVEMAVGNDAKDSPVTKVRRTLADNGQKMKVEVMPIVPAGQPTRTLVYVREEVVASTPVPVSAAEQK